MESEVEVKAEQLMEMEFGELIQLAQHYLDQEFEKSFVRNLMFDDKGEQFRSMLVSTILSRMKNSHHSKNDPSHPCPENVSSWTCQNIKKEDDDLIVPENENEKNFNVNESTINNQIKIKFEDPSGNGRPIKLNVLNPDKFDLTNCLGVKVQLEKISQMELIKWITPQITIKTEFEQEQAQTSQLKLGPSTGLQMENENLMILPELNLMDFETPVQIKFEPQEPEEILQDDPLSINFTEQNTPPQLTSITLNKFNLDGSHFLTDFIDGKPQLQDHSYHNHHVPTSSSNVSEEADLDDFLKPPRLQNRKQNFARIKKLFQDNLPAIPTIVKEAAPVDDPPARRVTPIQRPSRYTRKKIRAGNPNWANTGKVTINPEEGRQRARKSVKVIDDDNRIYTVDDDDRVICGVCSKDFKNINVLYNHRSMYHNPKKNSTNLSNQEESHDYY